MGFTSTVLIVDDEPAIRRGLEELLADEDYDLAFAGSGREALEAAATIIPDLILLDVRMPDLNGFQVCRKLREDPLLAEVPILMVTSLADRDSRLRGFEAGADDFLIKPIDPGELLARVRTTTRLNRYRRLLDEQAQRQQAEQELEATLRLLETISDHTHVAMAYLDPDLNFLRVNRAYAETAGREPSFFLGRGYFDLRPYLGRPRVFQAVLETGEPHFALAQPVAQDGDSADRTTYRDWSLVPVKDAHGGVTGLVLTMTDVTEQVHTQRTLRWQLEELRVLQAVATVAAEATDEYALIESATRIISRVFSPASFGVLLLDPSDGVLRPHPSYRSRKPADGLVFPKERTVAGQVLVSGWPRRISDVTREATALEVDSGIRSILCVPLKVSGQMLGVINAESTQPTAFSESNQRLLTTFAGQLATAIGQIRLMQSLEQRVTDRTQELSTLYEVTATTSKSIDLDVTLTQVLERVLEAVSGSTGGTIHLVDEIDKRLHLATYLGLPPHLVSAIKGAGDTLFDRVVERNGPLVVPDLALDSQSGWAKAPDVHQAYVGAPMRARGQVLGVLSVFRPPGSQSTAEEIALFGSVADHIGVAVENARLVQQAERTAITEERERLARELHDSVTQLLYSLTLLTEGNRRLAQSGQLESIDECLADLGQIGQQALKEMRLLIYELRPSVLEQEGLVEALRRRLEAVEGRAGIKTRFHVEGDLALPSETEEMLYRIAGEALNNSLKHAEASEVTLCLRATDDQVELEIIDDGTGFAPDAAAGSGGMGLASMQERVDKMGGALTILSTPGGGTTVNVTLEIHP